MDVGCFGGGPSRLCTEKVCWGRSPSRALDLPSGVGEVRSMAVAPVPGHAPISVGPAHAHSRLARWAVGLAGAVAVAIAASFAIFAIAYAIGGSGATEDNWVGFLGLVSLPGGVLAGAAAVALAVVARVKTER